jgi:hypothetical protein
VIGIDWSGSMSAGAKIWAAVLVPDAGRLRLERLVRPFAAAPARELVLRDFAGWLGSEVRRVDATAVGLDFCFSLPPTQARALGAASDSPRDLALRLAALATPDEFRRAAGREERRATDVQCLAPFAPTNLRMFRQTYLGIRCLGTLPATFALRPWEVADDGRVVVVEVLPANVVRTHLAGGFYKGRSEGARCARSRLIRQIGERFDLRVQSDDAGMIEQDCEGDAIDAVLAGLVALSARRSEPPVGDVPPGGRIYTF